MGWELEARLAKQGIDWRSIDDLMRVSVECGDKWAVDKLMAIKMGMKDADNENIAASYTATSPAKIPVSAK